MLYAKSIERCSLTSKGDVCPLFLNFTSYLRAFTTTHIAFQMSSQWACDREMRCEKARKKLKKNAENNVSREMVTAVEGKMKYFWSV